ncbi:unnamed protein product [Thelazia callipaeda]|uniref:Ubiquitin-like domain-containing protein n=1 Tax=Thelazia callipaeda TaxID=103827 RepID=A0A0N5CL38_THECL|nr:unnamed protein product [Thelazia callipaeda]
MQINVIVYNKTRNFAGHKIKINVLETDTILTVKDKIMSKTDIPVSVQNITFGDESLIRHHYIRDGYTIYSTPNYIETPEQPSL